MTSDEKKRMKLEKAIRRKDMRLMKKSEKRIIWKHRFWKMITWFGRCFTGVYKRLIDLLDKWGIRAKIASSILAQIILSFFIALITGIMVTIISMNMSVEKRENVSVSYEEGYEDILSISEDLYDESKDKSTLEEIEELISSREEIFSRFMDNPQIYITDAIGNVVMRNNNATAEKLDILDVIEKAGKTLVLSNNESKEVFRVFQLDHLDQPDQLMIYIASPRGHQVYETHIIAHGGIFPYINGVVAFLFIFMLLFRKKLQMITDISDALLLIADGDLDYEVMEVGSDELTLIAENINYMRRALKQEKEEQARVESTKNELISNVSHDLRTPLTSIMGYLGLIRTKKFRSDQEMFEFADIAYKKSEGLKVLIEDLFEYTLYTNADISLNRQFVSMNELLEQVVAEYIPVFEKNALTYAIDGPKGDIRVYIDPKRIVRVCDNLIMNCIKYSDKPSEVVIRLTSTKENVIVSFLNACEPLSVHEIDSLFERLYKRDKSRGSEGSGLGLAITKSIVETHGGSVFAKQKENIIEIGFELPIDWVAAN